MVVGKEICNQIFSIKSMQKIISVMEMVVVSKMCKVQECMQVICLYVDKMCQMIGYIVKVNVQYKYLFMVECEVKCVGYIVVLIDCGFCGGLNINLFKMFVCEMKVWKEKGVEIDLCVIGQKGVFFFWSYGGNVVVVLIYLGDNLSFEKFIGNVKVMLDVFLEGKIDCLYVVGNEFVNIMIQSLKVEQFLFLLEGEDEEEIKNQWDYFYEFDVRQIFDGFLLCFIEFQVYQGVVENLVCEQVVWMIVMKSVIDNVGGIIDEFQLVYNKVCQVVII